MGNRFIHGNSFLRTKYRETSAKTFLCVRKSNSTRKTLRTGIDPAGQKMTVCPFYAKKNSLKRNVHPNTVKGREYLMDLLKKDPLGSMVLENVKLSYAKSWAIRLSENGVAYNSVRNYQRSLKASFYMAIQDDYIRKNPFDFRLSDILDDDTEEKSH